MNKDIIAQLKAAAKDKSGLSPDLLRMIMQEAGPDLNGNTFDSLNDNDTSMCDAYAQHIKNYLYTYKNDATAIDPSIDPEEKHIGPMAQDIEKVNSACIKELEDGTKIVDTSRLALMNAGVIADLSRRMNEVEEALNGRR